MHRRDLEDGAARRDQPVEALAQGQPTDGPASGRTRADEGHRGEVGLDERQVGVGPERADPVGVELHARAEEVALQAEERRLQLLQSELAQADRTVSGIENALMAMRVRIENLNAILHHALDGLDDLIAARLAPGADKERIDERIWDLFGEEWAVMFTDLSGFSRRVAEFGIIHFLQTIQESERLLVAATRGHVDVRLQQARHLATVVALGQPAALDDQLAAVVRQAPAGVKPSWGGYIPSMLGFELCQRVKKLLVAEGKLSPGHGRALLAAGVLAEGQVGIGDPHIHGRHLCRAQVLLAE